MNQKNRILIVGAGFGANYAHAISADHDFTLAGITGRGGQYGKMLAEQLNCPYFSDVTSALQKSCPHAAVVAVRSEIVGGDGDKISQQILAKGIPVLQELPIHSKDLITTLHCAKKYKTKFAINPFYNRLKPILDLEKIIARLQTNTTILSVELRTTIQTFLQSQLVLSVLLNKTPHMKFNTYRMTSPHKWLISNYWGDIAVDTTILHRINPTHPDDASQPLMGFTLTTTDGELFIPSPWGPIVWERRLHQIPSNDAHIQQLDCHLGHPILHIKQYSINDADKSMQDYVYPAIRATIRALLQHDFLPQPSQLQRQLAVLRYVEAVTHHIGAPMPQRWSSPKLLNHLFRELL